jgi:hypothetical protein
MYKIFREKYDVPERMERQIRSFPAAVFLPPVLHGSELLPERAV